jgi:hypothetical protein
MNNKKSDEKNELKIYEDLYNKIKFVNSKLLSKSNDETGYTTATFDEIYLFYVSSHALSFLKAILISNENLSISTLLNARCIIEGYAFLEMNRKNKISKESKKLLNFQYAILEYKLYHKLTQLDGSILNIALLKKSYEISKNEFEKIISDHIEFKNIYKSNIPYLCDPNIKYEQIVQDNLDEEELKAYKMLSMIIHPHDYGNYTNDIYIEHIETILIILVKIFNKFDKEHSITFESEKSLLEKKSKDSFFIYDKTLRQVKKLKKLSLSFKKEFNGNFISNLLVEVSNIWLDITTDLLFGYTEHLKMKWKMLIEIAALFDYLYIYSENAQEKYEILKLFTKYKYYLNSNNDMHLDVLKQAFSKYNSKKYNTIDKFTKRFNSNIGFILDQARINNLTNLVFEYIDININVDSKTNNVSLRQIFKLFYRESQLLSHANGYMFFSNSGIWSDDIQIYSSFENIVILMLEKIKSIFDAHSKLENENKYKILIKDIKSAIDYISNISEKKKEIYIKPRVSKNLHFRFSN